MGDAITDQYTMLDSERDGEVLRIWLDRPHKLNAIDPVMLREVGDLFQSLEREHDAKVVVLGGKGRSFSAGADRRPEPDPDAPTSTRGKRWYAHLGRRACRAIEDCEIPTIARVQGHAVGGGMCFALSCDFRITTAGTQWYVPEVELAVPLTWAAIPRLIGEVGAARARQLVMLAERIDGSKAADWGIAHECVADEDLDAAVDRWAARVAALPELAIHMTKTTFRGYSRLTSMGDASEADADLIALANLHPDAAAIWRPQP
ncbi:MAG: enoyl-CoA hydratase/isomerase family protein [Actinomycetota bacterium]|nr:enoyl-CoA hydratase/isomerase family protein [Actinomycetota bacterium]